MTKTLVQYVRDLDRRPIGVVLATLDDDNEIRLGWSRCNKKDTFNKVAGVKLAAERAFRDNDIVLLREEYKTLPTEYCFNLMKILDRAVRYYKQANATDLMKELNK